jgi:HEAT repeat protein
MKRFVFFILVSQCVLNAFGQSEELDYYAGLFKRATSVSEQLAVLQTVSSEDIADSAPFFANALKTLLWQIPDTRTVLEKRALEEAIRVIAEQISQQEYTDAALDLWRTVEAFSNPIIRSDALSALGAIGATDYLPRIIRFLEQNNLYPSKPREDGERLAYGAITALGRFGDASAYMTVFVASKGWYSQWIKNYAAETLPSISDDPAEALVKGINNTLYSYQTRYEALVALDESTGSDELKSQGALYGLSEGWTHTPANNRELVTIRKRAIAMISKYGVADERAYTLLRRSYKEAYDMEEQFAVVSTLSHIGSDQAVNLLATFIYDINEKQRYGGLQGSDERLIRALIPALRETGSSAGDKVLKEIMLLNWTSNILELARESITDSGSSKK